MFIAVEEIKGPKLLLARQVEFKLDLSKLFESKENN